MGERWKNIEPGAWKPEKEDDSIEGVLVNKVPEDKATRLSARYYIETKTGMFFVWGCTVLDNRMQYVKVGQEVRITYKGQSKNQRNQTLNLYEVAVAEKETSPEEQNIAVDAEVIE